METIELKVSQYPMPFSVEFEWISADKWMSEIEWFCTIRLGNSIYATGKGDTQIGSLKGAIKNYEMRWNKKEPKESTGRKYKRLMEVKE